MEINYNQLLQFFTANRKPKQIDKLMAVPLHAFPSLKNTAQELPHHLKPIFFALFTEAEARPVDLRSLLPLKEYKTAMPVCNKLLQVNEAIYRCYNCTTHESAVLCMRCFERGNHQGHRFVKVQSVSGNCDCGNPDAIAQQGFCCDHRGRAEEMLIPEAQEEHFRKYVVPVFVWTLKLHQGGHKKEAQLLLTHLIDVLDWLNNESLYYNTLTNKLLFNWDHQMIDHILILGTANGAEMLAKKATELFLKMFSLQVFKENMAIAYLRAYNRLPKFEQTKFQSLFIQLFANNDLVERVIEKAKISLDPRDREYNTSNYYSSLHFMGSIRESSARAFFLPIIARGGIHCPFLEQIEKTVQLGSRKIEDLYSEFINTQNLFYSVNKVLIRLIKNTPHLLQLQLRNKYSSIMKGHFNKNKVVLVYQRLFAILLFVYFNCDYDSIDVDKLEQILDITHRQMKEFLQKLTKCFLYCLKEYGKCIGNSGFPRYPFQNYVDIYCRSSNGNRVITLDMLGLKICALSFHKLKEYEAFTTVITQLLNEEANKEHIINIEKDDWDSDEDEEEQEQQPANKPKSAQSSVLFFLGWLNTISLLNEAVIYDRAEVALINDLQMHQSRGFNATYEQQFKKLMLNAREQTMHEMESMGVYWFSKPIDKTVIAKYTTFDRARKKFVLREDVSGIAIKRQLLKSFIKTPDHYLRASEQLAIEINDQIRKWRQLFYPSSFIQRVYKTLIAHLRSSLDKDFDNYLKQLAHHLNIMNLLFEDDNEALDIIIDLVIALASNQKLKTELSSLLQGEKKEAVEQQQDKDKNEKRKEVLRRKKEEKLKMFKNKQNIDKFLSQNDKQPEKETNSDACIICHENNSQQPLFYLASIFSSNIVYSILGIGGINPFFLSCFHHVHQHCFLSITKEKEKIYCPLCKAITNIILPTQSNIDRQQQVETSIERMHVMFAIEYTKQFSNIYVEIMKSFIQLFFSNTLEQQLISNRQIKLFKLVLGLCRQRYTRWCEQQKQKFIDELLSVSSEYEKCSTDKYNFGLFIHFIFTLAAKHLKDSAITQQFFKEIITACSLLPHNDLRKCIKLGEHLFNLNHQCSTVLEELIQMQGRRELKNYIYTFDPPKSIRALLQERRQVENEQICKLGHNICICLICSWKGCFDCNACSVHTNKAHNNDSLYFNFITGGLQHQYNGVVINIRSLYVNDLGVSWKPQYEEEAFYFEIDMYNKLMQALKSGNLIQMVRSNYQYLKLSENSTMWSL